MSATEKGSITGGIQDVARNFGDVVRNEVKLAKAEAEAGIKDLVGAAALLGAGLALVIPALTLLGFAGGDLLSQQTDLPPWAATGLIGAAFAVLGFILVQGGRKAMNSSHAGFKTTGDNLKQDLQALKETTQ